MTFSVSTSHRRSTAVLNLPWTYRCRVWSVLTLQRSPVFGGEIAQIDDGAARIPGVIDVVRVGGKKGEDAFAGKQNIGESVAVVAEGYWQAKQGLAALAIEWQNFGKDAVGSDDIFAQFDHDITAAVDRGNDRMQGDVATALQSTQLK